MSYITRICLFYSQGEKVLTLPNLISLARICLIPPFVICLLQVQHQNSYRYVALGILLAVGISDILDGYFARKRGEITKLGIFLDPIADKLILLAACILLSSDKLWPGPGIPDWVLAIIISRELYFSLCIAGVFVFFKRKIECGPDKLGKFTTFMQITAIVAVLLGDLLPFTTIAVLWFLVSIVTLTSAITYTYKGIKQLCVI